MITDLRRYAAANARVRTLLPTLLGRRGLEALYGYPTAQAMVDALARTTYGPAMTAASVQSDGLGQRAVRLGAIVLGMLAEPERTFIRQYLLRREVENLKVVIRAVYRGLPWDRVAPHLTDLSGLSTLDARALVDARDLEDLAERLSGTPYGAPLAGALHRIDAAGAFAAEVALEVDYYDRLWSATRTLQSSDARRARDLLGILFDILNLTWIARYRDALGLLPEEVLNYTLGAGRWVTVAVRRVLAEGAPGTWEAVPARSPYARLLADAAARGFDAAAASLWQLLAAAVQRTLCTYPFHIGVPLGLLLAQDIEIRDIHVLLAAKRMGLPTDEALGHVASVRN
jgi:V/A-type H+/Na+-transporting ATPase subunit C